jgi:hypothetical protein
VWCGVTVLLVCAVAEIGPGIRCISLFHSNGASQVHAP